MTVTNRHLAVVGVSLAAVGIVLEWKNLFPGYASPLSNRGGSIPGTRPTVSSTPYTQGRVTVPGSSTGGLQLGQTLGGLSLALGSFIAKLTNASTKPDTSSKPGGGSTSASAPGGSAGSVNAGRSSPFNNDNTSTSGGADTGNAPYVDLAGNIAYKDPNSPTGLSDENGTPVFIDDTGGIQTATTGPNEPSNYDAGSMDQSPADNQASPTLVSDPTSTYYDPSDPQYDPTLDPSTVGSGPDNTPWDSTTSPDNGFINPDALLNSEPVPDATSVDDLGSDVMYGGGQASDYSDNMDFSSW